MNARGARGLLLNDFHSGSKARKESCRVVLLLRWPLTAAPALRA